MNNHSSAELLEVDSHHVGQRIDNFLMALFRQVPKSHIYRLLRTGQVRVNRGRIRPMYRLQLGDQVRIPPIKGSEKMDMPTLHPKLRKQIEQAIVYEDDSLLILDKPAGLAVHSGTGFQYGIIESLRQIRTDAPFLELAHRLDRSTSGCLLIAKHGQVLRDLQTQLRKGKMDKRYLALAAGHWQGGERTVNIPLRKNTLQGGERLVQADASGKPSETIFTLVEQYPDAALLEARLQTGRTHQIRVHLAEIGHPVAGDDKYGNPDLNRSLRKKGLRRLFLHAHYLGFASPAIDPNTGTIKHTDISVSVPLSEDLNGVLENLS